MVARGILGLVERWPAVGLWFTVGCTPLVEGTGDRAPGGDGGTTSASQSSMVEDEDDDEDDANDDAASVGGEGSTGFGTLGDGSTGMGADTDTGLDSGGAETGPPAGPHNGSYTGTFTTTLTVAGVGTYPCDGDISFTVDDAAAPHVSGDAACSVLVPELGNTPIGVFATFEGALAAPNASGTLTFTIPILLITDQGDWSGSFAGDTFTGELSGTVPIFQYTVTYNGSWDTMR